MKQSDAGKLLGLDGLVNQRMVKRAYQLASGKYHPDKGGSHHMMIAVNEAYETLKDFQGILQAGDTGYPDFLNEAINKIIGLEGINIEVCGAWVWVTGATKKYAKILGRKEGGAGFSYASKKKAWYFRPSDWVSQGRGKFSLDEIRDKHGSSTVEGRSFARLQGVS